MNALLAAADSVRAAASVGSPPTSERGSLIPSGNGMGNALLFGGTGVINWSTFEKEVLEHVEELKWKPRGQGSVAAYHRMRTDAQCQGMYLGLTLPIRRYNWFIEPNGATPALVDRIARAYNLPVRGQENQPKGRSKRRFVFNQHLRQALLAIIYGHMYFEQVGDIVNGQWVIRKLGARMPETIEKIVQASDGGVKSIVQAGMGLTSSGKQRTLDINRMLLYIWEQEGSNPTGRSMFRGIYKNFLLKDTVLRVGAINIERAGGVPVITGPKGASPDDLAELAKMARAFRVGANAGGAIPNGAELSLARAAGGEEAVNYIKLQNEEMSRGLLMMFMNLGQATTGSYALGSSLIDYALNTQEVVADWICDTFNEHMLEDDVDWNEGPNTEQVPLLGYKRTDDRQMALADLAKLSAQGLVTVDDELESWLREEYRMPRFDPESSSIRSLPAGAGSPPSSGETESDEVLEEAKDEITQAVLAQVDRRIAEARS